MRVLHDRHLARSHLARSHLARSHLQVSAGFLGVFYMIPLRRHMIVNQNLPFPSGTATAVLIDEM
jgi:uncharacterized oligopeptide transporter (OPT) family protein